MQLGLNRQESARRSIDSQAVAKIQGNPCSLGATSRIPRAEADGNYTRPAEVKWMEKLRLVLIEWEDSFGCSATWSPLPEPNEHPPEIMICRSVGWLLHDTSGRKTIVPHVIDEHPDAEQQGCGDMTIPISAIRRIVDLEEKQ